MKGFIFAAGFGERLRPITDNIPKSLLPVLNLPAICYAVFLLKKAGIEHIICNLHYRYRDIIEFFKAHDDFGAHVEFSIEKTILGTGGGLKKCEDLIGDSEVLLINADAIIDLDLTLLVADHEKNKSPATLVLHKTNMAPEIGHVSIDENEIIDFKNFLGTDKKSEHIYAGVGIVSPDIFKYLSKEFSSIVYTGYVELIKNYSVGFYELTGYWYDIGTVTSFCKANLDLMGKNSFLREKISSVLRIGTEIISQYADIGRDAIIVDSVIGKGAAIGKKAIVERSVILPGSVINDGVEVRNSVVFKDQIIKIKQSS